MVGCFVDKDNGSRRIGSGMAALSFSFFGGWLLEDCLEARSVQAGHGGRLGLADDGFAHGLVLFLFSLFLQLVCHPKGRPKVRDLLGALFLLRGGSGGAYERVYSQVTLFFFFLSSGLFQGWTGALMSQEGSSSLIKSSGEERIGFPSFCCLVF